MRVFHDVMPMQQWAREQKAQGYTLGLVPTMGYLHEGHLSLVREARVQCDRVAVSIFVNPIQFGPSEDYASYPRDLERDLALLEAAGVDAVFNPTPEAMYPEGFSSTVEVSGEITGKLCGKSRPGHFAGVCTVVSKLFNICLPDVAFFGQKDAQQLLVIQKMVRDLNFPVTIVPVPIMREPDGLAMSSRNVYLTPEERQSALALNRSLTMAKEMIESGERDPRRVKAAIREMIENAPGTRIDYVEIVNAENLGEVDLLVGRLLIALAVFVGKTRLIDNVFLEV